MKLATLRDGSRDGLLAVVSHDLSLAHVASGRARTLQQVLDDWNFLSPQLEDLSTSLNQGKARHAFGFDPRQCMAPLPRAFCWVRAAANGQDVLYAAGNGICGPTQDMPLPSPSPSPSPSGSLAADGGPEPMEPPVPPEPGLASESSAPRVQAGLAVLTGDIAAGADSSTAAAALEGVRLLVLAAHWQHAGHERSSFAPLAVTPDELGPAWRLGRVHATLLLQAGNHSRVSLAADQAQHWQPQGFGPLLARLAAAGGLPAGSLVGSGGLGDARVARVARVELRARELLRLECTGSDGFSVFGAIEQRCADAK
jgi:fumarylacetoacetate (FAA) hydrolase